MKTFKELCDGKMWKAVEAMLTGLSEQSKRTDFKINMATFGRSDHKVCFGCAATCTIQQLAGVNFTVSNIQDVGDRAYATQTDLYDLSNFETAINELREGMISPLVNYFDKGKDVNYPKIYTSLRSIQASLPILLDDWQYKLQPYYYLLNFLKQHDL